MANWEWAESTGRQNLDLSERRRVISIYQSIRDICKQMLYASQSNSIESAIQNVIRAKSPVT